MNQFGKNLAMWIVVALFLVFLTRMFQEPASPPNPPVAFSDFMTKVQEGAVTDASIRGRAILYNLKDAPAGQGEYLTYVPEGATVVDKLLEKKVRVVVKQEESGNNGLIMLLVNWLPMFLFVGMLFYLMRQMQSGSGKAMGFGKSRARLLTEKTGRVMFDDVAGIDEAKQELQEVVEFLRDPQKFQRLGGKIPKGVLLVGPPGTGKTLTARAVAGEANVPFFTISGSDFVEMFVGVGASRVRDMFEQAKKQAPCIVFIDEIDAVGRHRGAGLGGGNDEREQTLNQLLVEMDGFEANEGVILIAATNRPDVLDPA